MAGGVQDAADRTANSSFIFGVRVVGKMPGERAGRERGAQVHAAAGQTSQERLADALLSHGRGPAPGRADPAIVIQDPRLGKHHPGPHRLIEQAR